MTPALCSLGVLSLPAEEFKDGTAAARATLHANVREALVPIGNTLLRASAKSGANSVHDIFRGAKEAFLRVEPKDEVGVPPVMHFVLWVEECCLFPIPRK